MTTERRALAAEMRAKGRRLEGYAAIFGTEARIADFTEIIVPGAFRETLTNRADVLALVDHDAKRVLARTKSGTLRLAEDSRGLAFDLDVPSTGAGNDVLALAERGDLGGMSFGFTIRDGGEEWRGDRRELRSLNLLEISVVAAWPAYDGTIVHARNRPLPRPRLAAARRWMDAL
jgi:HK97 family phage prohead protease